MNNTPKVGDRVRIPELVGTVKSGFPDGYLEIAVEGVGSLDIDARHVEVLAKPVKVGDTVHFPKADELPRGTQIKFSSVESSSYVKIGREWGEVRTGGLYSASVFSRDVPYVIKYLPEQ